MRTEARRERVLETSANPTAQVSALPSGVNVSTSNPVPLHPPTIRFLYVAVIATAGVCWDLWSKREVFAQLGYRGIYPVWKGQVLGMSIRFQLETTLNFGALWGVGQGLSWLFATLSFVALTAIAYFLWKRHAIASLWLTLVTGLLLAGTLGNLYDRLGLHGWKDKAGNTVYAVRDFLDFYFFNDSFHWATFNFADVYLVVGACMLALHSLWLQPEDDPTPTTMT